MPGNNGRRVTLPSLSLLPLSFSWPAPINLAGTKDGRAPFIVTARVIHPLLQPKKPIQPPVSCLLFFSPPVHRLQFFLAFLFAEIRLWRHCHPHGQGKAQAAFPCSLFFLLAVYKVGNRFRFPFVLLTSIFPPFVFLVRGVLTCPASFSRAQQCRRRRRTRCSPGRAATSSGTTTSTASLQGQCRLQFYSRYPPDCFSASANPLLSFS